MGEKNKTKFEGTLDPNIKHRMSSKGFIELEAVVFNGSSKGSMNEGCCCFLICALFFVLVIFKNVPFQKGA